MNKNFSPSDLLVCRSLASDPVINAVATAVASPDSSGPEAVAALIISAENSNFSGNVLRSYIVSRLLTDQNIVNSTLERSGGQIGTSLKEAFVHDIEILLPLFIYKPSELIKGAPLFLDDYQSTNEADKTEVNAFVSSVISNAASVSDLVDGFLSYYRTYGYGDIAVYKAFSWNSDTKMLKGIQHFEPALLKDIIGYQRQKEALVKNTLAFLSGLPANNTLLVGDRGTGKSTCIKALANEYFRHGLRLVQIKKHQLKDLPSVMEHLRHFASKKFIIYLDDLSFEPSESDYKYVKSAIEGGVEPRPENVLIYATSNRRHLIHETWSDREEAADSELYNSDSVNETVSLSDRFGLIIKFRAPSQDEYLAIIDHDLRQEGVILSPEELRIEGKRWELEHSGRNGRTAKQFAAYYLGQRANHFILDPEV